MDQNTDQIRRNIEDTRDHLGETMDAIGDRVSPSKIVERRKNSVIVGVQSVRDRVMGTAHDTTASVAGSASSALDTVKDLPETMQRSTRGAPVIAGALAFGIGFLIAAAFPASEAEQAATTQLLDKLEPVKDQLTEAAGEMTDHLKQPVLDAAEAVKATATDAASHVSDSAQDAVAQTKDQASDSIDTVKTATPGQSA